MKRTKWFRFVLAAVIASFLAVFALGGAGITAYAAQDALPGDSLFAVKTGMEQARLALTRSAIDKARLNLQFADYRLNEMQQLADQGRYQDLETALAAFQASTGSAIDALGTLSLASDQIQAREMTTLVAGILTRQSLALTQMVSAMPEEARPVLQDSLATLATASPAVESSTQSTGNGLKYQGTVDSISDSAWVIDGVSYAVDGMTIVEGSIQVGDPVEFYVFTASDGSQTLWKVELSGSQDTSAGMEDDLDDPEQEDGMDDDAMDDQEGQGTVEAIAADSWTIDGVVYTLDANTMMAGTIQVGDWVEFHTYTTADGALVLASVKLELQDNSSLGENMDDSYDDDSYEQGMGEYEDGSQYGSMYTDDDHEYNSQPGNTGSYDDSADDDHSGQSYEDDHEDDHNQSSGSGEHSGDHEDDDHGGGDHEGHDD